ncbi:hypothetical protein GCM10011571_00360 [Marinithermofilum abyssi]|uniref:Helix-turn-helix domain-containing protein n=1 Tax=Marinithermofilum abyssi TaxID=1571185 RepID=A0A8J2Y8F4_9BACL|nr:helix-turn-helix domain-containing protein [Marinithermofilum abyssi]GGE03433.1 hypothetical protein GCM10011571_00360 [Marinithermofilum abyssi]
MWTEIGNQLRQARESKGISLDEMKDLIQVDKVSLQYLENGEFDKISSPFYVRSWIRAYAKKVDLEPAHLLKKYRPIPADGDHAGKGDGDFSQTTKMLPALPQGDQEPYDPYATRRFDTHALSKTSKFNTRAMKALQEPSSQASEAGKEADQGGYDPYRSAADKGMGRYASYSPDVSVEKEDSHDTGSYSRSSRVTDQTGRYTPASLSDEYDPYHSMQGSMSKDHEEWDDIEPESGTSEESAYDDAGPSLSRTQTYSSGRHRALSRTRSMRAVELEEESGHTPDATGVSALPATYVGNQELGRRSRRFTRRKKNGKGSLSSWVSKHGLKSRWARFAVAGAILLVPMTIFSAYAMMDKPESAHQTSGGASNNEPQVGIQSQGGSGGSAELVPVNQGSSHGISEYEVNGRGDLKLEFSAKDTSWVQVRESNQPNAGYLKDFTLHKGESYPFTHAGNVTTDLWITLGVPDNVHVKANGKTLRSAKTIHIKK